jgi:hypothetical protein
MDSREITNVDQNKEEDPEMIVIVEPVDWGMARNFLLAHRYADNIDVRGDENGPVGVYYYNNINMIEGETIHSIEGVFRDMIERNSHINNVRVIKIKVGFSILVEQTKNEPTIGYEQVGEENNLFVQYSTPRTNFDMVKSFPTTIVFGQHAEKLKNI